MDQATPAFVGRLGPDGPGAGARRSDLAYARARRHSQRVRFLRRAIPLGAVLAVAGVGLASLFNPFQAIEGLAIDSLAVSGTRIVMQAPRLTGFQEDTRPYEVTAREASQDVREPHLVDLVALRARVTLEDERNVVRVEAEKGLFDTKAEVLTLQQDVRVTSTTGYRLDLNSATVDVKTGSVVSDEGVTLSFDAGTIAARTLRIGEGGRVITFEGNVKTVLVPDEGIPDIAPRADALALDRSAGEGAPPARRIP